MSQHPYSPEFWDEREIWSRDQVASHQEQALRKQLLYLHSASAFYRTRLDAIGWDPADSASFAVDDLSKLPFTAKSDFVASLDDDPPFGSAAAVRQSQIRRVHFSSGTTSRPAPMLWSENDLTRWADLYARAAYSQGVRPDDLYQCLFGFAWFVGGLGAMAGYERLGCTCVPGGSSDTARQIETIFRLSTTVVGGTPSFLLHLAETAEQAGTPLSESSVRIVMTGGEPGGAVTGVRNQIERRWGARAFDGYGSIEFQPTAWECTAQQGGHLTEDFALAEILDPETHAPVPDGSPGVLVLTHLDKEAAPLLRWWTGDIVVRDAAACPCGRTLARLAGGVKGRSDDMLVIRGVNLFPSAIEDVIRRTEGAGDEYRIIIDSSLQDPSTGYPTGIRVEVEALGGSEDLADRLAARIRQELTVRAEITVVPPGTLERFTHKARRVIHQG